MAVPLHVPSFEDSARSWLEFQRHTGGAQRSTCTRTAQPNPVTFVVTVKFASWPAGAAAGASVGEK
mgnify:CR=1 FL=1